MTLNSWPADLYFPWGSFKSTECLVIHTATTVTANGSLPKEWENPPLQILVWDQQETLWITLIEPSTVHQKVHAQRKSQTSQRKRWGVRLLPRPHVRGSQSPAEVAKAKTTDAAGCPEDALQIRPFIKAGIPLAFCRDQLASLLEMDPLLKAASSNTEPGRK